jgi:hypothetical protein
MAGGAGVNVGCGVGVSGAGVEVGSPAGTVSVGRGVFVIVAVGGVVQVGNGVGCGGGAILVAYSVMMVTQIVPMTPISAAMIAGSIDLLFVDISILIDKFSFLPQFHRGRNTTHHDGEIILAI